MPTLETLAGKSRGNILKATTSALFIAPMAAPVVDSIFDSTTGQLVELPPEYRPVGWVDGEDGVTWSRETNVSEVIGHGSAYPVRSDITSDTTTVQAKLLETNMVTMELFYSAQDLSGALDYANKTITVDQALTPPKISYRFLAIGRDRSGPDAIYIVRHLPAASISSYGEQNWNNEGVPGYDVTLTAEPDDDAGFAVRNIFTGPGLTDERLTAMGYTIPAPTV